MRTLHSKITATSVWNKSVRMKIYLWYPEAARNTHRAHTNFLYGNMHVPPVDGYFTDYPTNEQVRSEVGMAPVQR